MNNLSKPQDKDKSYAKLDGEWTEIKNTKLEDLLKEDVILIKPKIINVIDSIKEES